MHVSNTNINLSFPEKKSKVTLTLTEVSFDDNSIKCDITDMNGNFHIQFDYKIDPINNLSDLLFFVDNLKDGRCQEFWIEVANKYQQKIDDIVSSLKYRYNSFEHDAYIEQKDKKLSTYFTDRGSRLFLPVKNASEISCLTHRMLDVIL